MIKKLKLLSTFLAAITFTSTFAAGLTQDRETGLFFPSDWQAQHLETLYGPDGTLAIKHIPLSISSKNGERDYCAPASILAAMNAGQVFTGENGVVCYESDIALFYALDALKHDPSTDNPVLQRLFEQKPDLKTAFDDELAKVGNDKTRPDILSLLVTTLANDKEFLRTNKAISTELKTFEKAKVFDQTVSCKKHKFGERSPIVLCLKTATTWYNSTAGTAPAAGVTQNRQFDLCKMLCLEELFDLSPDKTLVAKPLEFLIIMSISADFASKAEIKPAHIVLVKVATSTFFQEPSSVPSCEKGIAIEIFDTMVPQQPSVNGTPLANPNTLAGTDAILSEVILMLLHIQAYRADLFKSEQIHFQSSADKVGQIKHNPERIAETIVKKLNAQPSDLPKVKRPVTATKQKKTTSETARLPEIKRR